MPTQGVMKYPRAEVWASTPPVRKLQLQQAGGWSHVLPQGNNSGPTSYYGLLRLISWPLPLLSQQTRESCQGRSPALHFSHSHPTVCLFLAPTMCSLLQSDDGTIITILVRKLTPVRCFVQCPATRGQRNCDLNTNLSESLTCSSLPQPHLQPHVTVGLRNPAPDSKLTQSSPSHSLTAEPKPNPQLPITSVSTQNPQHLTPGTLSQPPRIPEATLPPRHPQSVKSTHWPWT